MPAGQPRPKTYEENLKYKRFYMSQKRQRRAYERVRDGERQRRLITRDLAGPLCWDVVKRRPTQPRVEPSAAMRAAFKELRSRVMECPRCGLLVDWTQCKVAANARRPAELRAGDGCLGAKCGTRSASVSKRRAAMQSRYGALEDGTKQLVAWPDSAQDTDVWLRPEEAKCRIVESLRARFGYAPR
jgi:hypothetical protein